MQNDQLEMFDSLVVNPDFSKLQKNGNVKFVPRNFVCRLFACTFSAEWFQQI